MKIVHELSDNVFSASSVDELEMAIKSFLTARRLSDWSVLIDGDTVLVSFPDVHDIDAEEDERIVIGFCNSGRFGKARKVIREWIEKTPWNSEAYRLAAQVEMMEGNIDDAIEKARVSLKLNPRNLYALILLGNLICRDKGMPEDAVKWYRRASELYPDSSLAVNNYAGCLLQCGNYDESEVESLFRRAIKLDKTNLQPYYGLASLAINRKDYKETFIIARDGLLNGVEKPENPLPVKEVMTEILVRVSRELSKEIRFDLLKAKSEELAKDFQVFPRR